jgi:murein DD-endopeptidase MepM/ murein hydrolase activator NlpD
MACGAVAIAGWTLFATGSYILGGGSIGAAGGADQQEVVKYERWVQELRAKDALTRSQLQERTEAYTASTVTMEDRHNKLEDLLEQLQNEDDLEISALQGDNSTLLIKATIEEADSRQSREMAVQTASLVSVGSRAREDAIESAQTDILNKMEDIAVARAERARGVLKLTSVGSDRIIGDEGMGGPLVPMAAYTPTDLSQEEAFESRAAQVEARVAEARYYRSIVANLPLAAPVGDKYRKTSNYGLRVDPFNKRPGWHNGLDLAAYRNAPIVAAGPGKITFAGTKSGYGRLVEIDHGHGFKSRYGHLRKILVKKGDIVEVGHDIGKMGTTGRSTGDHLHYEVWFKNKPYDPEKFLKAGQYVHQE